MKALHDLSLPAPLRAAIQAVRHRLTAECSVERLMLFGSERYRQNSATRQCRSKGSEDAITS
jgi:hypothetical protein